MCVCVCVGGVGLLKGWSDNVHFGFFEPFKLVLLHIWGQPINWGGECKDASLTKTNPWSDILFLKCLKVIKSSSYCIHIFAFILCAKCLKNTLNLKLQLPPSFALLLHNPVNQTGLVTFCGHPATMRFKPIDFTNDIFISFLLKIKRKSWKEGLNPQRE